MKERIHYHISEVVFHSRLVFTGVSTARHLHQSGISWQTSAQTVLLDLELQRFLFYC